MVYDVMIFLKLNNDETKWNEFATKWNKLEIKRVKNSLKYSYEINFKGVMYKWNHQLVEWAVKVD